MCKDDFLKCRQILLGNSFVDCRNLYRLTLLLCVLHPVGLGRVEFSPPYFPPNHLVCAATQWDLRSAGRLSHTSEAATHPGRRACMEERTG